jgi:exodeoxyribonuclease VII large subunit
VQESREFPGDCEEAAGLQTEQTEQHGPAIGNLVEQTVSELSASLRRVVEDSFGMVRVRGEVGRVSRPGSGHIYLDLKDDRAVLAAVIWKTAAARLKTFPEQGLEVVATGRLTTFPGQSRYQIMIETLEPAGAGALMALLEERRKKLEAEGLFATGRKRRLPYLPRVIGVVTSPTGAVIRDVLHRIADRFPLHVIVWPVRVQGETCGAEVAAAIRGFNALGADGPAVRPDLIIVARGGGSIEDLWGFNDEQAVRAAAESAIPLISAVGHETDWTLIDLAADQRAPTPTGAAEIAVPVKAELDAAVATLLSRLKSCTTRNLERARADLRSAARALGAPEDILSVPRQTLDNASARLSRALAFVTGHKRADLRACAIRLEPGLLGRRIEVARDRLESVRQRCERAFCAFVERNRTRFQHAVSQLGWRRLERMTGNARLQLDNVWRLLGSLSHQRVLERGFAVVRNSAGMTVTSAADLAPGEDFRLQFRDGALDAAVKRDASPQPTGRKRAARSGGGQGNLF